MNPIRSCALAAATAVALLPLGAGAVCSSYTRITDAALVSISDGLVEGYHEAFSEVGSSLVVRFASVSSGNAYTCKEVFTYRLTDAPDQEKLNDQIRRAAVLSMSLGYEFSGRIDTQNGESRLLSAGVSK